MSSNSFSAHLTPDPWLRIIVQVSARLLYAAGLILILLPDVHNLAKSLAAISWLLLAGFELKRLQRGFDACNAIRLTAEGNIAVRGDDEAWQPATLLSGSIVLRKLAWLRLRAADGQLVHELLTGDSRESHDWRRLQMLWRHVGAWL